MLVNRKCNYCGSEYYICRSCIKAGNAWKNVCCSKKCFIELMKDTPVVQPIKIINKEDEMKKVLLRGELKSGKTIDITGYDIDLGKFDSTSGKTYTYDDVKFFYIGSDEFKDIIITAKLNATKQAEAIAKKTSKKTDANTSAQSDSNASNTSDDNTIKENDVKAVDGTVK